MAPSALWSSVRATGVGCGVWGGVREGGGRVATLLHHRAFCRCGKDLQTKRQIATQTSQLLARRVDEQIRFFFPPVGTNEALFECLHDGESRD